MALVKFGAGVADMRGSIGGTVFSRNRFGAIARNRSKPVDPSSANQQVLRIAIQTLAVLWHSTLTAAQRAAWDAYAQAVPWLNRLGETQYLTGFNMYCRSNASILQAGIDRIDAGPTELSLPETDPTFAITATADDQKVAVAFDADLDWANEDGGYMLIFVSAPKNPTRNFFKGPYRYVGKIDGDGAAPPTSGVEFDAPFTIAAGQKIFAQARIVRADGRLSQPFRDSGIVAAA